jgi:hypothetical protein
MRTNLQKGNSLVGLIILVGLIWGASSIFSKDELSTDEPSYAANSYSAFQNDYVSESADYNEEYANDEYDNVADTFHGYECTDDCSGHEAGYQWAEDNGIVDENDCGGNSNSFVEGCYAYVENN